MLCSVTEGNLRRPNSRTNRPKCGAGPPPAETPCHDRNDWRQPGPAISGCSDGGEARPTVPSVKRSSATTRAPRNPWPGNRFAASARATHDEHIRLRSLLEPVDSQPGPLPWTHAVRPTGEGLGTA